MHHVLAALQGLKVLELLGFPVQEWGGGEGGVRVRWFQRFGVSVPGPNLSQRRSQKFPPFTELRVLEFTEACPNLPSTPEAA